MPLRLVSALLFLAGIAGAPDSGGAQPFPGQALPFPGQAEPFAGQPMTPEFRPGPPVVEVVSPRVTGSPFTQLWRAIDLNGGSGNTGIVRHPTTGFIYVGNSQGVLEYDGARWRLLPLRHGGAVLAVAVDERSRIWVVSENEVARFETDAEGVLHAASVVHPLPDGEIGVMDQLLAAPDGMWVRGVQHILRVAPDGQVATWRTGERFGLIWLMENAVHTKLSERSMVRLEDGGGLRVMLERESLRVPRNRPSPFQVYAARQVAPTEWLLLTAIGPAVWNSAAGRWRPFRIQPPLFRDAEASGATFLPDGAMVFLTSRPGGFVVTAAGRVERVLDRMPGILDVRVVQMAADDEGGLWLTTRDQIARLQLRSAFARHEGNGLQGNPRHIVAHDGELFVAHTAGVSRHAEWPGFFPPTMGLRQGAETLAIVGNSVFAAAAGLVELADYGRVARTWSNLAINTVSAVRATPGTILGGGSDGVWWFRREDDEWKAVGRLRQPAGGVQSIFDSGDGWVWGTSGDGRIWRADFRSGPSLDAPIAFFGPDRGVPAYPRAARINLLTVGGALVATSASWMLRYDAAGNRFVPESRVAGLGSTATQGAEAVGINSDGTCWLRMGPPDRRILRVLPDGAERWRTEEIPAPMIRDLEAIHLCQDRGTLWVAGKDLLTSIDLKWQAPPLPPLVVRLRSVTMSGGRIWRRDGVEGPKGPLALEEGDGSVRVEFAAATFVNNHRGRPCVQYRSQLGGLEREWQAWSSEPWRDFTRLPAGDYVFRVQATDQAGRTSAEASLAIVVQAPWWRSRWAWAGYVAGTGLILFGGVRLRTRALRRRAGRLEELIAARTEELRRSNAELARLHQLELDEKAAARLAEEEARLEVLRYQLNPHFLYNALNSIYSLALTSPPSAAGMVLRLADFCRIALDRRQEENTTVGAEFDKLSIYFEIEKVRWGESLQITIETDDAARRAILPPFLLLPLVENAMKYGGATSPEKLSVRVTARLEQESLWLTVANTGKWIERTGSRPPQSGIGLANLRQRLQRYHPQAHELTIDTPDGWVVVTVCLKMVQRPMPADLSPAGARVV